MLSLTKNSKCRVHAFTGCAPGLAANNYDVKFRLAELVLICDLDYVIIHHLVNSDGSYNELRRIQSYVGDAMGLYR